jgi:hypothetical protein
MRVSSSGIRRRVVSRVVPDVSEERIASIFRVEEVISASLPPAYLVVLAEIISSTLKMEAICSSETSVAIQQTTRRHIPEDGTLLILLSVYVYISIAVKTSNPTK